MITLTLPKFILQCRTLNQHNELRIRTFGFAVSVSSECFGILRNPDRTRTRTRTRRKSGLEKNPDPDSKKIRTRV